MARDDPRQRREFAAIALRSMAACAAYSLAALGLQAFRRNRAASAPRTERTERDGRRARACAAGLRRRGALCRAARRHALAASLVGSRERTGSRGRRIRGPRSGPTATMMARPGAEPDAAPGAAADAAADAAPWMRRARGRMDAARRGPPAPAGWADENDEYGEEDGEEGEGVLLRGRLTVPTGRSRPSGRRRPTSSATRARRCGRRTNSKEATAPRGGGGARGARGAARRCRRPARRRRRARRCWPSSTMSCERCACDQVAQLGSLDGGAHGESVHGVMGDDGEPFVPIDVEWKNINVIKNERLRQQKESSADGAMDRWLRQLMILTCPRPRAPSQDKVPTARKPEVENGDAAGRRREPGRPPTLRSGWHACAPPWAAAPCS